MGDRVSAVGEGTSLWDRKVRAGQRMVIGLPGPSVDDDVRRLIKEIRPAGFILFKRNVESPEQVRELNRELASLVDPAYPALLSVDQEGGRVQRIREPAVVWPAMREVGRAEEWTRQISTAMARELRAMGFNLNFAPVADVDSNPDNPVIGDRSFSSDPQVAAAHAVAFLEAHQAEGLMACAKHFPGHGDTHLDSHLALPSVPVSQDRLDRVELVPFQACVEAGVASVMSAHVVFPELDPDHPATLSPVVIPRLLRKRMGFDGVLFSDDMDMKAVAGRWPVDRQVDLATRASVDVFLACESVSRQLEVYRALVQTQEQDSGHDRASQASVRRLTAMRERFLLEPPPVPSLDVLADMDARVLAQTVRLRGQS